MDKSYPSKTPMVVRSLDVEKDPFRPRDDGDEILGLNVPSGLNVPFLNAIGSTKPNWLGLKNIFRYPQGIKHLVLVFQFQRNLNTNIIGYIDQILTMLDHRQA